MSLVLDASMTMAWLFIDERTPGALDVMHRVVEHGAVVPSLWRLEVANVLRNAERKGRCDAAFAEASLARLARLPITVDSETDTHAWGAIRMVSDAEALTPFDAAYLELALRKGLPLATTDTALIAAAQQRQVQVYSA